MNVTFHFVKEGYEGQVWRELGDMNCEIKLTSRFEGFTSIYLIFFGGGDTLLHAYLMCVT